MSEACKTCQLLITEDAPYLESYYGVYATQALPPLPPSDNLILNGPQQYVTPPVTPPVPPSPPAPPIPPGIPGPQDDSPGTPTGDPNDDAPTGPGTGGNTSSPGGPPPPAPTPNDPNNPTPEVRDYGNVTVFFNNCTAGTEMQFTGSTPQWIMFNGTSLQGREGVFRGETQEIADQAAQDEIDSFAQAAIDNGDLTCVPVVACPAVLTSYAFTLPTSTIYVPGTDRIWLGRNSQGIQIINPADGSSVNAAVGTIDTLVYAHGAGRVFGTYYTGFTYEIHYFNTVTGADLGTLVSPGFLLPSYNTIRNHIYSQVANEIHVFDATTLAPAFQITDIPDNPPHCPAWCADNGQLYVGSNGVGIRVYDGATGASVTTIALAETFYAAVWAANASRIAIAAYDGVNYKVHFIDTATDTIVDTVIITTVPYDRRFSVFMDNGNDQIYVMGGTPNHTLIDPSIPDIICTLGNGRTVLNLGFATSNNTTWIPSNGFPQLVFVYQ